MALGPIGMVALRGEAETVEFRSPGLELVVERLASEGRHEVLDLGAASADNLEFYATSPCRIWVEDLETHLIGRPYEAPDDDPGFHDRRVAEALCHDPSARFDLVMGWDLFDYLDRETIAALMKRVSSCCQPGALLFLMASTTREIPDRPARITVSHGQRLLYTPRGVGMIPNPRYSPLALERMMPRFRLLHSFLLAEGMQDYLFSFT